MRWFNSRRWPYVVTVHLDGRHPYLRGNELDFATRDVVPTVPAKNWNDAAEQALLGIRGLKYWRASVSHIAGPGSFSVQS